MNRNEAPVILYEDNHLLAADKPAGLLTQADATGHAALEDQLREYVRTARNKPGAIFLHAAHRLDREVGGIVLFALTSKALSRLNEQQRENAWDKRYRAWVQGSPADERGMLTHWLAHASHRAQLTAAGAEGSKECRLEYEVVRRNASRTLLAIRLHTGRYHQIRAQLATAGWPVLGDAKYGATSSWPAGIALRHVSLTIEHPVRRVPLSIEAPSPEFA